MDRWDLLSVASSLASIFVPLMIVLSGKQWRAAQHKAHARRLAEYRMNARPLRLDI